MSNAELIATIAHILEPWAFETKSYNATIARDDATAKAEQIVEALDSRAGDAGEVKAYRCRGCGWRGSEPIANGHPQNGCDLELMVHDPIATPAPAVDAVPAGEVRKMVKTLRGEMAAAPKRDWYPVHRDYLDAILSAALSHGEGRK